MTGYIFNRVWKNQDGKTTTNGSFPKANASVWNADLMLIVTPLRFEHQRALRSRGSDLSGWSRFGGQVGTGTLGSRVS